MKNIDNYMVSRPEECVIAVEDIQPDKTFVVYAGDERYPVSEGLEAVSVVEMAEELRGKQ